MDITTIEYLRFDNLEQGVLVAGKDYILSHEDHPVTVVKMLQDHITLLRDIDRCFQYNSPVSQEEKNEKIRELSALLKPLFVTEHIERENTHVDLVLNAMELGLLPFELLLDDAGEPYFASEKKRTLTRRIRQKRKRSDFKIPAVPKMLFAYAHGKGLQVPFKNHQYYLDQALQKWGGIENFRVLKVLPEADFETLKNELRSNDTEESHYTHVHILAHGALILDAVSPYEMEYGIALGSAATPTSPIADFKDLFESLDHKPYMVNYMVCDGAHFLNPFKPDKNPVQVTHKAGVPIVLGAQFPLTMKGSEMITRKLYAGLFNGNDLRSVLHQIRRDLYKHNTDNHDWISLTAYARIPREYYRYQVPNDLEAKMQELKYARSLADKCTKTENFSQDAFLNIRKRLVDCIDGLENLLKNIIDDPAYDSQVLENLGQLGSAYKRLAELCFAYRKLNGQNCTQEEMEALQKARYYYKQACSKNLSHHWATVQYLSLETILSGGLCDWEYWNTAKVAIDCSIRKDGTDGWAFGSRLELLLLASLERKTDEPALLATAQKIAEIARQKNTPYLVASTRDQLLRYRNWWTKENGFPSNTTSAAIDTELIDTLLKSLMESKDTT